METSLYILFFVRLFTEGPTLIFLKTGNIQEEMTDETSFGQTGLL